MTDPNQYKKCIVLGSNSFGGSCFVNEALNRDKEVIGISRSEEPHDIFLPYKLNKNASAFRFLQMDVNNDCDKIIGTIADEKPDFIVDFAALGMVAPSWQWPEQWYHTNIVSKAKIHNAVRKMDFVKRYMRISTPEVYGSTDGGLLKETMAFYPTTPYAVSQAATDMSLVAYFKEYNFPVILTRFANFYGASQQLYRIVPRAIYCALTGDTLPLHGGGHSERAFIHGTDVSSGIFAALEKGSLGETYHFSTTEFVSIRALVQKIADIAGVSFDSFVEDVADRPGKDAAYFLDASKARSDLNWVPEYDLEKGLDESFAWVEKYMDIIKGMSKDYTHKY